MAKIRMRYSNRKWGPDDIFQNKKFWATLYVCVNRPYPPEGEPPQLLFGRQSNNNSIATNCSGPVWMLSSTDTGTINISTSYARDSLRFVPYDNPNFLLNTTPGLQTYTGLSTWVGMAIDTRAGNSKFVIGVTCPDNIPQFPLNIRLGYNNLVNYTQGGIIQLGAQMGVGTYPVDDTANLSMSSKPGSIYIAPNGVNKTPNSDRIINNTLIGNRIWESAGAYSGRETSPIYNRGICSNVTIIGSKAAQSWGQNQYYNKTTQEIQYSIWIDSCTAIGYLAVQKNCGRPLGDSQQTNNSTLTEVISIGSQNLIGDTTSYEDFNTGKGFPAFPGGSLISIGYKTLQANRRWNWDTQSLPGESCTRSVIFGNENITKYPFATLYNPYVNREIIIGNKVQEEAANDPGLIRIPQPRFPTNSLRGSNNICLGRYRETDTGTINWNNYLQGNNCMIGDNLSHNRPTDTQKLFIIGRINTLANGYGTIPDKSTYFATGNGKSPVSFVNRAWSPATPLAAQSGYLMSQGDDQPAKFASFTEMAEQAGGVSGTFQIDDNGVLKTVTVESGLVTSIQ